MKLTCSWQEKMCFTASADGHQVLMDARSPIGTDQAMSPKQLVLAGVCGCTAMDVVSLLRKYKEDAKSCVVEADAEQTKEKYPHVFSRVNLKFKVTGTIAKEKLIEAVHLSQTKYCGVSAMIAKGCPIHYEIFLNEEWIGSGNADFASET
jgi:putative redox protein